MRKNSEKEDETDRADAEYEMRIQAEREKEDETDLANAECEMRLQEKKIADKKLRAAELKIQATQKALMAMPEEDQRELGWTDEDYQNKARQSKQSMEENLSYKSSLNDTIGKTKNTGIESEKKLMFFFKY